MSMQDYEREVSDILSANPALRRLPGFEVKTLTGAFERGQEAGVKAEEAQELQQIEARVLAARDPRIANFLSREPRSDSAILGASMSFRRGYIVGLQEFLPAHKVDMGGVVVHPQATPESLRSDDALVGYLRGMRRQSPNRARDLFQRTVAEKPFNFNKLQDYEREPEWLARLRFQTRQQQGGYELGFFVGVARDFGVTLSGLEIPNDNPAYDAFMQGSRGESRSMPFKLQPRTSKYEINTYTQWDYGFGGGVWAYDAIDDSYYKVGQRVWLVSEGIDVFYAAFIRHPEALRTFQAALAGQVLAEYEPKRPSVETVIPYKGIFDEYHFSKSLNYLLHEKIEKIEFNQFRPPIDLLKTSDPVAEYEKAGRTGYEMGQLARLGRQRQGK